MILRFENVAQQLDLQKSILHSIILNQKENDNNNMIVKLANLKINPKAVGMAVARP